VESGEWRVESGEWSSRGEREARTKTRKKEQPDTVDAEPRLALALYSRLSTLVILYLLAALGCASRLNGLAML